MNIKFSNELCKRENARLNAELKPEEKFCPTCGGAIKKTMELCSHCDTIRPKITVSPEGLVEEMWLSGERCMNELRLKLKEATK